MTLKGPSEDQIHRAVAEWVLWNEGKYPPLRRLFHPPNGGKRNIVTASKFKAMLVRRGVPDLMLPWSNGVFAGLAIELKSDAGKLSDPQQGWIMFLREQNWFVEVCYDAESAIFTIEQYFKLATQ